MAHIETLSTVRAFGGQQGVYRHESAVLGCPMEFSVFLPPRVIETDQSAPVLWYLSGLTCTQENATTKAGFQRLAAELGLVVICPDTSPRGAKVADDPSYDLGQGAGFYLTATEAPWAEHYKMDQYILEELTGIFEDCEASDMSRQGITGHSMGGHGALTLALKNKARFRSVSAFSPIVNPVDVPWGQKALTAYLGEDQAAWQAHDACALLRSGGAAPWPILIDLGLADPFLERELKPDHFAAAAEEVGQSLTLRQHEGYDHSYFFIATMMGDHLHHHAKALYA